MVVGYAAGPFPTWSESARGIGRRRRQRPINVSRTEAARQKRRKVMGANRTRDRTLPKAIAASTQIDVKLVQLTDPGWDRTSAGASRLPRRPM